METVHTAAYDPGSNSAYNSHRKVCHLLHEEQSIFEEKDDLHPLRRPRDAKPYIYINPYVPRTVAYDPVAAVPTTVTARSVTSKSTLKPEAPVYTPKSAVTRGLVQLAILGSLYSPRLTWNLIMTVSNLYTVPAHIQRSNPQKITYLCSNVSPVTKGRGPSRRTGARHQTVYALWTAHKNIARPGRIFSPFSFRLSLEIRGTILFRR